MRVEQCEEGGGYSGALEFGYDDDDHGEKVIHEFLLIIEKKKK